LRLSLDSFFHDGIVKTPFRPMLGPLVTHFPSTTSFIVRSGAAQTGVVTEARQIVLEVAMPRLAGPESERIIDGGSASCESMFHLLRGPDFIAGAGLAELGQPPQEAARSLYATLLGQLGDHQLQRVWNYLPDINRQVEDVENYRAFNRGRYEAFQNHFGKDFQPRLPAASAIGTRGGRLAVAFLAGTAPMQHFENPEQVPALQYPSEYGVVPPAFARGTLVDHPHERSWFLSGTASIKGHATQGKDIHEQLQLTLDNVQIMFRRMGLPPEAAASWKIFLRHAGDLPVVKAAFEKSFPAFAQNAMFVLADICRSGLLLEIEANCHAPAADHKNA
jgi:chorismate lyase/3-hydroxybenzoate synthase